MLEKLNVMKNTINPSTNQSYTIDFRPDLTVGEMRGKILFMCRSWTKYNDAGPVVGGYHDWSFQRRRRGVYLGTVVCYRDIEYSGLL